MNMTQLKAQEELFIKAIAHLKAAKQRDPYYVSDVMMFYAM